MQYAQIYFYASAFDDYIRDEVRFAPARDTANEDYLKSHILSASKQYGMDVDFKGIRVKKTENYQQQLETLEVSVSYSAPLDLNLFKKQLRFTTDANVTY